MNWQNLDFVVSGGTGSLGKRFTEIVLREYHPERLIIYSRDELKQHQMRTGGFEHPSLRYFIGGVPERIVPEVNRILAGDAPEGGVPELWDGRAAERIVNVLVQDLADKSHRTGAFCPSQGDPPPD